MTPEERPRLIIFLSAAFVFAISCIPYARGDYLKSIDGQMTVLVILVMWIAYCSKKEN